MPVGPDRPPRLIQDILREKVLRRPDKVALVCEHQRLTYAQVDVMATRLANALRNNGVRDGDRVLLHLLNSSELVVALFAALKANAVFSVVDYAARFDSLRSIAADCQAAALVTSGLQAESASRLMHELSSLRFGVLTGQGVGTSAPNLLGFDAIQAESEPVPLPEPATDRDVAYLVYTSGTTGTGKGVVVTHRSSLATVTNAVEYFGLCEHDVLASPLPLSFSPGLNQLLLAFRVGGRLILERSFAYPAATLWRMVTEGATGLAAVPTILTLLTRMDLCRYDLSRLRYMSSIGAALAPDTIRLLRRLFPGVSLFSTYGMAEASYSLGLSPAQIDERPASVGKPFPGTQAWIVDEQGRPLGPGQTGELVVRGAHVRSGYWNDPAASAQRFRPGPVPGESVCFTGDMFRTDQDGYFYFVARSDEIIKSGAKKVVPREIENALYAIDGVLEAAAIGVPDAVLGQVIKAFVVPDARSRASLTIERVLSHCEQHLEGFKVPRQIEIRDSLPKTASGKIRKTELA